MVTMGENRDKSELKLVYNCEWDSCDYQDDVADQFYQHVVDHIPQTPVVPAEDEEEMYQCPWKNCTHTSNSSQDIVSHVRNHGYLAMLKSKGVAVASKRNLPSCNYTEDEGSALRQWSKSYACHWEGCAQDSFSGFREFVLHVQKHVEYTGRGPRPYRCGWRECSFATSSTVWKLADHAKVHSGERAIACPSCGNTFVNVTKFSDHCIRQKTSIDENFKCPLCFTYLPNERIFRDHTRQHINHHKCCFCEMTCHSPSVLSSHILYRHLPYRPFKCSSCDRSCKSALDLKIHLKKVHAKESTCKINCTENDCDFKCHGQAAFMRHLYTVHGDGTNKDGGLFACHFCDKKYVRGSVLTKHLQTIHNLVKPDGHSRLIYRLEADGLFRLRPIRLESLAAMDIDERQIKDFSEDFLLEDLAAAPHSSKTPSQTIIDIVNEKGEIISCSSNTAVTSVDALPPDAKVVAVFDNPETSQDCPASVD